jgi:isoleucyl-tRNA synthetase
MNGVAPYKQVLTHGFTVDAKGMKMSKSMGNVVAPQKVINSLGADILRLWVASTDYSGEMSISDEILKRTADSYRRIRNTMRFLLANMKGFEPNQNMVDKSELLALDRWVVAETLALQNELKQLYDSYQFHVAIQKIHNFCSETLGGFYLDIIKDRQYTTQEDSLARRSCQSALYHVAEAMTRWITPILSFTADEVWQHIPGEHTDMGVFISTWYEGLFDYQNSEISVELWSMLLALREQTSGILETLRQDGKIGSGLDADIVIYCDEELLKVLEAIGEELRFVMITSEASLAKLEDAPKDCNIRSIDGDRFQFAIEANSSPFTKCVRCWHHREDVGTHTKHPELCGRCVDNVAGDGEQRRFA